MIDLQHRLRLGGCGAFIEQWRFEMEKNRVSETLENILDSIDTICDNIETGKYNSDVSASSAVLVLARAFDLIARSDDIFFEESCDCPASNAGLDIIPSRECAYKSECLFQGNCDYCPDVNNDVFH